jgi:hypothetical protein
MEASRSMEMGDYDEDVVYFIQSSGKIWGKGIKMQN